MSSAATRAEKDAAAQAAKDAAKKEAEDAAKSSALDFIKKNPKLTITAAALSAYMIQHGITDPAEAAADMAKELGGGLGGGLDAIFASLKKYLWVIFAIPVFILFIFILYKLISSVGK